MIDLGNGFSMRYYGWHPDRDMKANAENFANDPDVEKAGIILTCPHGDGGVSFIIEGHRLYQKGWTVECWEPLTLSPSILRTECGCHGHIQQGKWVPA